MNLYQIQQIPYKEKKLLVHEACLMYKKLKEINKKLESQNLSVNDNVKATHMSNIKTLSMFEMIISLLHPNHAWIIEQEFLNDRPYYEHQEKWSKTTYYRIKHEAIDQFVFLMFS